MQPSVGLVTVVMPVRDGGAWLAETVRAVAAQRGVRLQCIAVDDGSTDGSATLLRRHGWTVLATDGVGPNIARARGLTVAAGDMIAFLDQDDVWHPDHLALGSRMLEAVPEAPAVVARRVAFRGRCPPLGGRRLGPPTFDPWAVYPINVIDAPSMVLVRRGPLESAGGWPADRRLGSDPLLWWRLSAAAPFALLPRRTVGVRKSDRSFSAVSRERPLDYLRLLRAAAADAVASRARGDGGAIETTGDRILAAVAAVVAAVIDGAGVAEPAAALEAALDGASDAMVVATVGFCGWLLSPHLRRPPAPADDPVALLIDSWPVAAKRTRAAAMPMVGAVAGPWRTTASLAATRSGPRRLAVTGAAWAVAIAARCGRVTDPLDLPFGRPRGVAAVESAR